LRASVSQDSEQGWIPDLGFVSSDSGWGGSILIKI